MPVALPFAFETTTTMVLSPTARLIGADVDPFATAAPFTVMLKPFGAVAETVVLVVENGAATVYPLVAALKFGLSAPADIDRSVTVAFPGTMPTDPVPRDELVSDSQPAAESAMAAVSTVTYRILTLMSVGGCNNRSRQRGKRQLVL